MSSDKPPDRQTFDVIIREGLALTRSMCRHSDNGNATYVPGKWEVINTVGQCYGTGHTKQGAIDAAFLKLATPQVWRVLAARE